ncbi:MAG: hypothetical protein H6818_02120 [Phycisphaerales bacterium]|nr:hypothetical protein [Phycisphaerales bacterium]
MAKMECNGLLLLAAGVTDGGGFGLVDWSIVVGYLAFSTWLGARMAGKQSTMRDFFLGGRKLPWYAVSGSIIATEISAMTFVVVPFIVFTKGGNFTYLSLGVFGTLIARFIVGYLLIPVYYEREIYSPYDYMGRKLGGRVRGMTTALFSLGGVLGQSARVYLTAVILEVILHDLFAWMTAHVGLSGLAWAIILIGVVAIGWTMIGGITTVIWTDLLLFILFLVGAIAALIAIACALPGGFGELVRTGWNATDGSGAWGKFTFFNWEHRWPQVLTEPYTMVAAIIAVTWASVHYLGTDQLFVQRMFCCKGIREARWALISSFVGQVVTFTVAFVGVGLYAYYLSPEHTLTGAAKTLYEQNGNRIFPIFIVYSGEIPVGVKGLVIAAILAAAISSLTSVLAALSQTLMSALGVVDHDAVDVSAEQHRASVRWGRVCVLLWGVVLCVMAYGAQYAEGKYGSILDLGLAMIGYTGGALLAGFFLGFLPLRITGRGYMWAAPLSVLFVFAAVWHRDWSLWVCALGGGLILLAWIAYTLRGVSARSVLPRGAQGLILLAAVGLMIVLNRYGYWQGPATNANGSLKVVTIAWPWYIPLGSVVAFVLGWGLSEREPRSEPRP